MSVVNEEAARTDRGRGAPGVIAAVRRGREVRREAVGVADTTTGRPRSVDEHFRIGSVTKLFTATVLLQLVAEGRVDLDERCRQLLNHTSGVFDYGDDPGFLDAFTGTAFLAARFRSGHLLPPDLQGRLLTEAPDSSYGLGIVRWSLPDGVNVWGHNGMIHGSFTIVAEPATASEWSPSTSTAPPATTRSRRSATCSAPYARRRGSADPAVGRAEAAGTLRRLGCRRGGRRAG